MQPVTVFLRTALFSSDNDTAHVPRGVMVVEGSILDREAGTLIVKTTAMRDVLGRTLSEAELTLELPLAKIDHILRG